MIYHVLPVPNRLHADFDWHGKAILDKAASGFSAAASRGLCTMQMPLRKEARFVASLDAKASPDERDAVKKADPVAHLIKTLPACLTR